MKSNELIYMVIQTLLISALADPDSILSKAGLSQVSSEKLRLQLITWKKELICKSYCEVIHVMPSHLENLIITRIVICNA